MPRGSFSLTLMVALLVGACVSDDVVAPEPECASNSPNKALGKDVSASAWLDVHPPSLAVDGSTETYWTSGALPQQWIEIDLGETVAVSCVRARIHLDGDGPTVHRMNGGAHVNPGRELTTIHGETGDLKWLRIEGEWEFQFLRITTLESESLVSWYEIEVR